jgi:flagellar motor switch protein FliN/FliY
VNPVRTNILNWLFGELAAHARSAFEGMTGEHPRVETHAGAEAPKDAALQWRQAFSGIPGAVWMVASEADISAAGAMVLRAAGLAETDPARLKSEFLEILNQTLAGAALAISTRTGREVRTAEGGEVAAVPDKVEWVSIEVTLGEAHTQVSAGIEGLLLDALVAQAAGEVEAAPGKPQTFDLLLDVELPVSVSFGRAQVPLKDVLKLTTGSIVELNRSIGDPVEVIVNNCVIARGEVVTVEGNFGVRIDEVISRQERLRTLV